MNIETCSADIERRNCNIEGGHGDIDFDIAFIDSCPADIETSTVNIET